MLKRLALVAALLTGRAEKALVELVNRSTSNHFRLSRCQILSDQVISESYQGLEV
jgi:hypothetical protein